MKILIAEDDAVSLALLESLLIEWGYSVIAVTDGKAALEVLQSKDSPQIVILDWMMPEIDGLTVCQRVRELNKDRYVYIIFLTAKILTEDILNGLKAGADDYMVKPFNACELQMRINAGRRIIELEEKLHNMAITDELTKIYNRRGFLALSENQLSIARRQNRPVFLLYADIDNLKEINDISGHKAGDEAIIDTARILKATYRKSDIIARISGDEFAVFLMANSENDAYVISSRLQKNVDNHNNSCDRKLSLSYGMAVFPPDSIQNLEDMLVQADNLMYQHKKSKKAP